MVLVGLLEHLGQDVDHMMELVIQVVVVLLERLEDLVEIGVNKELKVEVMEAVVDNQVEQ